MSEKTTTHNFPAARAAGLALRPGAGLGVRKPDFYGDPVFHKALFMILLCSTATSILMYLHHIGLIDARVKNLYVMFLYPCFLQGALYLNGDLTPKRIVGLLLNMILFPAWQYMVYGNYKLYTLSFPVAIAIIIFWALFRPQIINRLGIRLDHLFRDILAALAICLAVSCYTMLGMRTWGFEFKAFAAWPTLAHTSSLLAENLIGTCLYFTVWSHMKKKGIYMLESIGLLLCLALAFQMPFIPYHYITGATGTFRLFASVIFVSLVMTLIMTITFRRLKNILPATILITTLFELARMAGLL